MEREIMPATKMRKSEESQADYLVRLRALEMQQDKPLLMLVAGVLAFMIIGCMLMLWFTA